jgi:charged multivesicular body protein 5
MNRLFGSSPSKPPKSTLNDAIASVSADIGLRGLIVLSVIANRRNLSNECAIPKTDSRAASLEVKIAKLDADLGRYKSQMAKLRTGPAKVRTQCLQILDRGGLIQTASSFLTE